MNQPIKEPTKLTTGQGFDRITALRENFEREADVVRLEAVRRLRERHDKREAAILARCHDATSVKQLLAAAEAERDAE
jgi:hypothetical protein